MPTIVKHYDKKTGKIRVYESTPHYDPVSKQSRPKRKYLGTLDPETNELIPSSGRRGRRPNPNKITKNDTTISIDVLQKEMESLRRSNASKDREIQKLKTDVQELKLQLSLYRKAYSKILKTMNDLPFN